MHLSFLFVFIFLQLAFHDVYNGFSFVKIELQNSTTKWQYKFCKKPAALAWIHQLLNLFDHK